MRVRYVPEAQIHRHAISVALFGMLVQHWYGNWALSVYANAAVLLSEGQFTFDQLSGLPAPTTPGIWQEACSYPSGSSIFLSLLRPMLLTSALATAELDSGDGKVLTQPALVIDPLSGGRRQCRCDDLWLTDRSASYPASLRDRSVVLGVGAGILLGNEYVAVCILRFHRTLWLGAAAASALFFVLLVILLPSRDHVLPAAAPVKTEHQPMSRWLLALLYGLAGFGYIIVATYLPLMAKKCRFAAVDCHLWSLVGISIIPGVSRLWAARRWELLQCLTANLLIQSACVVMTLASGSLPLLVISSMGLAQRLWELLHW